MRDRLHERGPWCGQSRRRFCYGELFLKRQVDAERGCWLWTGYVASNGYGQVRLGTYAHRLSLQVWRGVSLTSAAPNALHTCDVKRCFRPDHLYAGTQKENARDASERGLMHPGERTGGAKLTALQVQEIRRRYADGDISMAALGHDYGVTQGAINEIVRRRNWRWLPDEGQAA